MTWDETYRDHLRLRWDGSVEALSYSAVRARRSEMAEELALCLQHADLTLEDDSVLTGAGDPHDLWTALLTRDAWREAHTEVMRRQSDTSSGAGDE